MDPSQQKVKEICLDTETTGFYPKGGDRIVELGCVELSRYGISDNIFHRIINPNRSIPDEVVKVHGISNDMVKDKPFFEDVIDDFIKFIEGAVVIIHNAPFDVPFLDEEFKRAGRKPFREYVSEIIDSLELAKRKFPQQHNSLDALCNRFSIDLSVRAKHGAYIDAKLLGQVYLKLRQSQSSFELDSSAALSESAKFTGDVSKLKVIRANEAELAEHEKYLDGMEKKLKGPSNYRKTPEEFEAARMAERESLAAARKKIQDLIDNL